MERPFLQPPDPAGAWPLRDIEADFQAFVGRRTRDVEKAIGDPDSVSRGLTWACAEEAGRTYTRDHSGKIVPAYAFGMVPHTIPIGQPYLTWSYQNVRGTTWLLYAVKGSIVEVAAYPTGAVF